MTTGPNDGSRSAPTRPSTPLELRADQDRVAAGQQVARRSGRTCVGGPRARAGRHRCRCGARGGDLDHGRERGAPSNPSSRGGRLVGGRAAARRGRRRSRVARRGLATATGSPGSGTGRARRARRRPRRAATGGGPVAGPGGLPGPADRACGAGRPVEHGDPGGLRQVGVRAGRARRHPAHVDRHVDAVGAQPLGRRRGRPRRTRVGRRPLQQHRDDGVDLAGAGEQVDERGVDGREQRPGRGDVDRVRRARVRRQQRPDLLLEGWARARGRRAPRRRAGRPARHRYRRCW